MIVTVVGLAFEARIVARAGMPVICGGDGNTLAAALDKAVLRGCTGLVSFGVAGGLSPDVRPGTCVVASAVLWGSRRHATDTAWSRSLIQAIPDAVHGTILGVSSAVAHTDEKQSLYRATGALAVDMESHIVAEAAAAHGLPMIAIRAVTDPAERAVPRAALAAVRANGTVDFVALMRALARRPREIPALLRTALDAGAARTALEQGRQALGVISARPAPIAVELAEQQACAI